MKVKVYLITQAGIIAAAYIAMTLLVAPLAFGQLQLRLSEALTALAVLTPAAIPGLFLGCLLSNILNPNNLGLVDIILGSLATLVAAVLTWILGRRLRENDLPQVGRTIGALLPAVIANGLIVGSYLPFLLFPDAAQTLWTLLFSMLLIAISEAAVVYLIGWPMLYGLRKAKLKLYVKE